MRCFELFHLSSVVLGILQDGKMDTCKSGVGLFSQIRRTDVNTLPPQFHRSIHFHMKSVSCQMFIRTFFFSCAPIWIKELKLRYSCAICCWACLCGLHIFSKYIKAILYSDKF